MIDSDINTDDLDKLRDKYKYYVPRRLRSNECNDKIQVMLYDNVKRIAGRQAFITEVINDIRTKSERKSVSDKKKLPVAYFSASHISGRKKNENVTKHSGLIICDIDIDDNPGTDFIQLKKDICNDKYIYACFNSPRGGIKTVVLTNIKSKELHASYFKSVKQYFLNKYHLTEIDPSGCNIARACYLPYDNHCYFNPNSFRYSLHDDEIKETIANIKINKQLKSLSKSIHNIAAISYEEHYDNIVNLLKKRTEIGIYGNIFNNYRYYNIERGVMDTSVPFLELIILKHSYPSKLDWETRLDEYYFKDNPQKQVNILNIGCSEGLEICKVGLSKNYKIKEHFRAITLGSISMKLIFNNPFCHPSKLISEVIRINDYFCEDPHPLTNPKPDDEEVRQVVLRNYNAFLSGELDFNTVIRRKTKTNEISRKFVFKSKQYSPIERSITHLEAVRTYHDGKRNMNMEKFEQAISVLQDGKRINQKRIADYMSVSTRTVRRYLTDDFNAVIKKYNTNLKLVRTTGK